MNQPKGKVDAEAIAYAGELVEDHFWSPLDSSMEVQAQRAGVFMTVWPKSQHYKLLSIQ